MRCWCPAPGHCCWCSSSAAISRRNCRKPWFRPENRQNGFLSKPSPLLPPAYSPQRNEGHEEQNGLLHKLSILPDDRSHPALWSRRRPPCQRTVLLFSSHLERKNSPRLNPHDLFLYSQWSGYGSGMQSQNQSSPPQEPAVLRNQWWSDLPPRKPSDLTVLTPCSSNDSRNIYQYGHTPQYPFCLH